MTQTSITAMVTIDHIDSDLPEHAGYLALLESAKTELEAIEAGMHNQTPEARALQNAGWSAQNEENQRIVLEALQAGVPSADITAIMHRECW
jgi:hypothetical protein